MKVAIYCRVSTRDRQDINTQIEFLKETSEEESEKKKAKNMLKKLTKVMWGQEKLTIFLDDPNGNSAIISEKVKFKK